MIILLDLMLWVWAARRMACRMLIWMPLSGHVEFAVMGLPGMEALPWMSLLLLML